MMKGEKEIQKITPREIGENFTVYYAYHVTNLTVRH